MGHKKPAPVRRKHCAKPMTWWGLSLARNLIVRYLVVVIFIQTAPLLIGSGVFFIDVSLIDG
ncbi:hypothetical protein OS21_17430 [Dickeya oryzae]